MIVNSWLILLSVNIFSQSNYVWGSVSMKINLLTDYNKPICNCSLFSYDSRVGLIR